jgi:pimeloyl-ACP methyl ester carboxylesterase
VSVLAPFRRLPFEALPDKPHRPHAFFDAQAMDVPLAPVDFPSFSCRVYRLGSGPPLLLVHGLMTSAYSFRYVLGPLAQHFTCYAADLPGAGGSEAPLSARYTFAALGRVLAALSGALGLERPAMIANSMGGVIGMFAALDHPEVFSRLVQVHGPAWPTTRYRALGLALALPGTRGVLKALVQRDPERWVHRNVHYYDETLKSLEEARTYAAPLRTEAGFLAFHKYLRETMDPRGITKLRRRLQDRRGRGEPFPIPLQLVYSRTDPLVPPVIAERLHAVLPEAELVWLDEASHFAHVDAVERFLPPVLRFLGV